MNAKPVQRWLVPHQDWAIHTVLTRELYDRQEAISLDRIFGYGDYDQATRTVTRPEFNQLRNLTLTVGTPGSPEINDHRMAAPAAQPGHCSIQIAKSEI